MVALVFSPARWTASITSSQRSPEIFSGQICSRTFGAKISAPPPGMEPRPASFSSAMTCFDALPGEGGEVVDLHRGEGLDVQRRVVGADGGEHLQVEVEGELGMQPADHVDLRRPGRRRLGALLQDVVQRQGVAPLVLHPLGKGAEGAAVDADVGVVDVAVDVEVDLVAVLQPVGQGRQFADGEQVVGLRRAPAPRRR